MLWQTADVAMGVALLAVALSRLEAPVTASNALLFVVLMVSGVLIVYAIWIALTTLVFWYVRIVNITMIFSQLFQTGRYPIEVYPFWLRQMLTFVFPVAFITTVPAQTVVGRDPSCSSGPVRRSPSSPRCSPPGSGGLASAATPAHRAERLSRPVGAPPAPVRDSAPRLACPESSGP